MNLLKTIRKKRYKVPLGLFDDPGYLNWIFDKEKMFDSKHRDYISNYVFLELPINVYKIPEKQLMKFADRPKPKHNPDLWNWMFDIETKMRLKITESLINKYIRNLKIKRLWKRI